jgi:hypothetical protein
MRTKSLLLVVVFVLTVVLSAQAQTIRKSTADLHPWQPEKLSRSADKAWFGDKPNCSKSNFKASKRTRAYYRSAGKMAIKEAKEISASKKASNKEIRLKTKNDYQLKYIEQAKEAGVKIKKNRRNS